MTRNWWYAHKWLEARSTRVSKWKVSKHYDPPCEYPWEVEGPDGQLSDVFETWAEAIEHAMAASHE